MTIVTVCECKTNLKIQLLENFKSKTKKTNIGNIEFSYDPHVACVSV